MPDGSVFLSRYADVVAVYKDSATFSSDKREEFAPKYGASPLFEHHTTSLVFNDPPLHTRVRRLIAGALTPRHIAAMEARLVELVDALLDVIAARGPGAEIDLIDAFASAIPVEIIGNLLAVPHEERGAAARLVARHPRRARAGAHARAARARQPRGAASSCSTSKAWSSGAAPSRGDPEIDVLTRLIARRGRRGAERAPSCCTTASSCSTPATRRRPT